MNGPVPNKTVRELIQVTTAYFEEKDVESARLNAERLLADVLGLTRIELYFQHDRPVMGAELDRYRDLVRRRAGGEPLQQILGETEFYSRTFKVEPGVFIPRPETERLVEACTEILAPGDRNLVSPLAVEVGCGTGIIGITLALELPRLTVHATDVNPLAVDLAARNAHLLGCDVRMSFYQGNRLAPVPAHLKGTVDLLVSNPPYIPTDEIPDLSAEVADHDPREALDGGSDGLNVYRALASEMRDWVRPGGHIAVEIGFDQGPQVVEIFTASGAQDVTTIQDYAGLDRVVTARLGEGIE
jgi:release factor glutamine methyltransferase